MAEDLNSVIQTRFETNADLRPVEALERRFDEYAKAAKAAGQEVDESVKKNIQSLIDEQKQLDALAKTLEKNENALIRDKKKFGADDAGILTRELELKGDKALYKADYENLKGHINDAANSLSEAEKKLEGVESQGERTSRTLQEGFSGADSAAGALAQTLGGLFSLKLAGDFVKKIANVRGEFQQLEVAFTTMLGSAEKASTLMDDVIELAATTPYGVQDVSAGAKQLMAYGESVETVIDTLRRCGDIAAGVSVPLNQVVGVYGRILAQGKLTGRTLLQFTTAGIPIVEQLSKTLGKTEMQVREMITAGKVTADDVLQALRGMTDEGGKFANLMEKQSKTITGRISNLEDAIEAMFNNIGKKAEGPIGKVIDAATSVIENYETLGYVIAGIIGTYGLERAAVIALAASKGLLTKWSWEHAKAVTKEALTTKGAAAAQIAFNKAILSNPYVLAGAALLGLTAALVSYKIAGIAADKVERDLVKSSTALDARYVTEMADLTRLKSVLSNAEVGTKAWNDARKEYVNKFSKYDENLKTEKLDNEALAKSIDKVTDSLTKSSKVRTYKSFIENATKTLNDSINDDLDKIQKAVQRAFGNGDEYGVMYSKVINYLYGDGKIEDINNSKLIRKGRMDIFSIINRAKKNIEKSTSLQKDALSRFGLSEEDMGFETDEQRNARLAAERKKKNEELQAKEKQRLYNLNNKIIENTKRNSRDRAKAEFEAQQAEIDAMEEGYAKKLKQNELNYRKEMQQLKEQREDKLKQLQEDEKTIWLAQDPNRKDYDFKTTITEDSDVWKEWAEHYTTMEKAAQDKWVRSNVDAYEAVVDKYGEFAAKLAQKEAEWATERSEIEAAMNEESDAAMREHYKNVLEWRQKAHDLEIAQMEYDNVSEYGTYEERMAALTKKWQAFIATLNDESQKFNATQAMRGELYDLEKEFVGTFQKIFADVDGMSRDTISATILLAEKELEKMIETGAATIEQITELRNRIDELKEARRNAGLAGLKTTSFEELITIKDNKQSAKAYLDDLKKRRETLVDEAMEMYGTEPWSPAALEAIEKYDEKIEQATDTLEKFGLEEGEAYAMLTSTKLAEGLDEIGDCLIRISETTADETFADLGNSLKGASELLSSAQSIFVKVASGNEVGAAFELLSIVANKVMSNIEALVKTKTEWEDFLEDFEREKKMIELTVDSSQHTSIFGTDSWGMAQDAWKKSQAAMEDYRKACEDLGDEAVKTGEKLDWGKILKNFGMFGSVGLIFGGVTSDLKKSIKEFDIWGEDGMLDEKKARAFLDTNKQITEEQRKQIENALALKDKYNEAMDALESYASSVVGNMASDLGNMVCDAILSGEDAFDDLGLVGAQVIDNLARSMAQSFILNSYLDTFKEDLKEAFGSGDPNEVSSVIGTMMQGLPDAMKAAKDTAEQIYQYASEAGVDIDAIRDQQRKATQSSLGASQESVDESNGRLTAIQGHTSEILESVNNIKMQNAQLVAVSESILMQVTGIHEDTTAIREDLADIHDSVGQSNYYLGRMVDRGVKAI